MPATGAMAEPAIPRRWMCSTFFSVRVKSLFLKETVKNAGETPAVRKSKSQAAGRRPFVSQDKPAVRRATSKSPKNILGRENHDEQAGSKISSLPSPSADRRA